jgi:hypothetical protein
VREGAPDEVARAGGLDSTLEEAFLNLARPANRPR